MPQSLRESRYQSRSVRWMTALISWLIFALPFIVISGYGSYASLRYFVFGTASLILSVLTAVAWLRQSSLMRPLSKRPAVYAVLGYLAAYMLVSFTGVDPAVSFFSTFQRADGGFALIFLTIFTFSVYTAIRLGGEQTLYRFLRSSVLSAAIFSILVSLSFDGFGLLESGIFERSRGGATIGNSSLAVFYVVWNIFFAIALFMHEPEKRRKVKWAAAFALMLTSPLFLNWHTSFGKGAVDSFVSLVGVARGGVLGLFAGCAVAIAVWLARDTGRKQLVAGRILLGCIVVVTCVSGTLLLQKSSTLHRKFAEVASGARFIFWDSALKGFAERPIFGFGPNTYSVVYHRYFNPDIFLPENSGEVLVDKPHNLFFETLAGGGVVLFAALLAYLGAIFMLLWRLSRRQRVLGSLLMGAFIAWLIQMQFIFDSIASLAMLALTIGIGLMSDALDEPERPKSVFTVRDKVILTIVAIISVGLFVYAIALPMRKAQVMFGVRNMKLPARADSWQTLSGISPMGDDYDAVITFARAYATYQSNAFALRDGDKAKKEVALRELDAINAYLLTLLTHNEEKYELVFVAVQMHFIRLVIDNKAPEKTWEDARWLIERAIELSPSDPRPYQVREELKALHK